MFSAYFHYQFIILVICSFLTKQMEKENDNGELQHFNRIELYKITHYDEGNGWTSEKAEGNYVSNLFE